MIRNKTYIILTTILLICSIFGAVYLIRQSQDPRRQADAPSCPAGTHYVTTINPCCGCQMSKTETVCEYDNNPGQYNNISGPCVLDRGYCFDTCSGSGNCTGDNWYCQRNQCPADHVFSDVDCLNNGDCCCIKVGGGPGPTGGGEPGGECNPPGCDANQLNMSVSSTSVRQGQTITFSLSGSQGSTHLNDTFSGGVNCPGYSGWPASQTCTATTPGTHTWTHTWRNCACDFDHCSSTTCSKSVTFTVTANPTNTPIPTSTPRPTNTPVPTRVPTAPPAGTKCQAKSGQCISQNACADDSSTGREDCPAGQVCCVEVIPTQTECQAHGGFCTSSSDGCTGNYANYRCTEDARCCIPDDDDCTPPTCDASKLNMTLSSSSIAAGQPITFSLSGTQGSTHVRDIFSGGVNCPGFNVNWPVSQTCSATNPGSFTWTHYWKNCACDTDNCSSNECFKSVTFTVTAGAPACDPDKVNMNISKTSIGVGQSITFSLSGTQGSTNVNDIFSGGVDCSDFDIGWPVSQSCATTTPGTYTWTHTWKNCAENNCNITSELCTKTKTFSIVTNTPTPKPSEIPTASPIPHTPTPIYVYISLTPVPSSPPVIVYVTQPPGSNPSNTSAPPRATSTKSPVAQGPSPTVVVLPQAGIELPFTTLTILGVIISLVGILVLL